jgi:hypothetical protein
MQCLGQPDHFLYPAELQDSGLYQLICRNGHNTFICVQEQKFEVLFELALNAIIDGYYREAIVSFSSCLERFYEFYLRVMCVKSELDKSIVNSAWKIISKQSERQFGAYTFVYLIKNKSHAPILSQENVTFRNDVIHKGKIPSRNEAIKYGEDILQIISPILSELKKMLMSKLVKWF